MTSKPAIRVLLADDHKIVREGLRVLLDRVEGVEVIAEAGEGIEALSLIETMQPNIGWRISECRIWMASNCQNACRPLFRKSASSFFRCMNRRNISRRLFALERPVICS